MSEDTINEITSWSGAIKLIRTSNRGTAKAIARECVQRQHSNQNLVNYVEWAVQENERIPAIERLALVQDLREYHKGVLHEYSKLESIKTNLHAIRTIRDPYYRAEMLLVVKDQIKHRDLAYYTRGIQWQEQLIDMYRYIRESTYKKMRAEMQYSYPLRIDLH